MSNEETYYDGWHVELLHDNVRWKALVYKSNLACHEAKIPSGQGCRAVVEEAKSLIDEALTS